AAAVAASVSHLGGVSAAASAYGTADDAGYPHDGGPDGWLHEQQRAPAGFSSGTTAGRRGSEGAAQSDGRASAGAGGEGGEAAGGRGSDGDAGRHHRGGSGASDDEGSRGSQGSGDAASPTAAAAAAAVTTFDVDAAAHAPESMVIDPFWAVELAGRLVQRLI